MDDDDAVSVVSLSELLRRGLPLNGAASLPSSSKSNQNPQTLSPLHLHNSTDPNPNPNVLTSLKTRSVLIGTITLPHDSVKCSNKNCFQFFDDSASVCCDVLNFRVRTVGRMIRVLAWNFLPLKHSTGGFLEIIKWSFVDSSAISSRGDVLSSCSSLDSSALVSDVSSCSAPFRKEKSKACLCLYGPIESVSPVSRVPCSTGDGKSQNLRGFVVRILVCECNLCNFQDSFAIINNVVQGYNYHTFRKPLFIYFYGSAGCWHPVIGKLVGSVVALSGLKKKLVFIGKEESQLMCVTTKSSVLYAHFPAKKWVPFERKSIKGRGECGVYTGIVKGVYMQGMVVELDNEVWLLITDQLLAVPHSLRLGAIISVRNVHFVNPKFPWTKMLILGACSKTSINIESFSPLETRSHNLSQSESQLRKFIESLTFSARMWALLVVSCFRKKFAGLLSEKEILGSKHKVGLAQKYATSHLSPLMFRARHGVLAELCKHDSLGCGTEPYCGNLKLVLPISTFLQYCETIWTRALLQFKRKGQKFSTLSCEEISDAVPWRRILLSKDINVMLLGSLQASPSFGRLQLGDSTGSINVTLPDFPSSWIADSIYEVVNYCIVMEGLPDLSVDLLQFLGNRSLSCRKIFHCTAQERELKLRIYAYFQSRNAACKSCLIFHHLSQDHDFEELLSGRFHLILVTHKYPMLQKQFQGEQMTSDGSTLFVEVVVLPWDVSLAGKDDISDPDEVHGLQLNDFMEDNIGENGQEFLPRKRHKPYQTSSGPFPSCLTDDRLYVESELGTSSSSFNLSMEMKCNNLCFHRTPCTAKVCSASGSNLLVAGKLCCTKCKDRNGTDYKQSILKVLLEFNSESFFNYQLLQIGKCYMIKHQEGEYFCGTTESDNTSVDKILVTSKANLWSLSFTSDDVTGSRVSSDGVSWYNLNFTYEDVLMKDFNELTLKWPTVNSPESFSDVYLHLCTDVKVLLEEKLNEIKDDLIKITIVHEDTIDEPPHILNTMTFSESPDSSCLFPEGNLISVLGNVVAIHDLDFKSANLHLRCETEGDCFHRRFFEMFRGRFCIHVLVENQMVNICSMLINYAYPIGFGPGVTATFHRLLKLRGASKWMLTPVSFIVINSIREVNQPCQRVCISSDFLSALHMPPISTLENVSSGMIYELIRSEHNKPMQLYCRVVAVHFLVLEKNRKHHYITSKVHSKSPNVNISVAGFVFDDGSSACCCWASSLQAATLLRLHEEIPDTALKSSGGKVKWTEVSDRTTEYHLERILNKHERITVRSFGSMLYSSLQELTISVSPDDTLCCSDETLLKFIIFNACLGTSWTVVASAMDSDAVKKLEKDYLVQMDVPVHITNHVWAIEVCHTDALANSRNLIQGLLSS